MSVKVGTQDIKKAYIGTTEVKSIYLGATKVWSSFSPSSFGGLVIWLDAAGYTGSSWPNKGSGPAPAIVGSPAPTISPVQKNGLPVVRFGANDAKLRFTGTGVTKDYTLIYVARMWQTVYAGRIVCGTYPAGGNILFGWWNGFMDLAYATGGGGFFTPDTRISHNTQWRMYSGDCDTPAVKPRLFSNGVLMGEHPSPPAADGWGGTFNISGYDATGAQECTDCEVAEVLLYSRKLSDTERQQDEAYLRTKWGL